MRWPEQIVRYAPAVNPLWNVCVVAVSLLDVFAGGGPENVEDEE